MLTNTHRWSHAPGNTVVPSRWQATSATGYVSEGTYASQQVARRAYYQLTGGKPKVNLPEQPQVVRSGAFPSKAQQRAMDQAIVRAARINP